MGFQAHNTPERGRVYCIQWYPWYLRHSLQRVHWNFVASIHWIRIQALQSAKRCNSLFILSIYVYIYMCMCMYMHMHTLCVHAYANIVCICVCICMCICKHCMHTRTCAHMCTYVCICRYMNINMRMNDNTVYTYINIHQHIYVETPMSIPLRMRPISAAITKIKQIETYWFRKKHVLLSMRPLPVQILGLLSK